jgi:hypothetical protein
MKMTTRITAIVAIALFLITTRFTVIDKVSNKTSLENPQLPNNAQLKITRPPSTEPFTPVLMANKRPEFSCFFKSLIWLMPFSELGNQLSII